MNNETTDQTVSQPNSTEQPADPTAAETGTSEQAPSTESQTVETQTEPTPEQTTEDEAAATQSGDETTAPEPADPQPLDSGTSTDTYFVTTFDTDKGSISVVHDITLGDLILSTILMAILIFMVLDRFIRR
jgi:cobalamin biosynthesis Mg chelatase CobN